MTLGLSLKLSPEAIASLQSRQSISNVVLQETDNRLDDDESNGGKENTA
jgi:hypothetical protein